MGYDVVHEYEYINVLSKYLYSAQAKRDDRDGTYIWYLTVCYQRTQFLL